MYYLLFVYHYTQNPIETRREGRSRGRCHVTTRVPSSVQSPPVEVLQEGGKMPTRGPIQLGWIKSATHAAHSRDLRVGLTSEGKERHWHVELDLSLYPVFTPLPTEVNVPCPLPSVTMARLHG